MAFCPSSSDVDGEAIASLEIRGRACVPPAPRAQALEVLRPASRTMEDPVLRPGLAIPGSSVGCGDYFGHVVPAQHASQRGTAAGLARIATGRKHLPVLHRHSDLTLHFIYSDAASGGLP